MWIDLALFALSALSMLAAARNFLQHGRDLGFWG
jgi:hypothetical protein